MSAPRVNGLDGLRGVAVGLVVLGHAFSMGAGDASGPWADALRILFNGGTGVTVFFVLSGFLITGILLRERDRTGRISIAHFYRRRALRILPAYVVFLVVVGVLGALGLLRVAGADLAAASTFVSNYWLPHGTWVMGHTWSLSVEEQFYLLWPLVLILLPARRATWVAGAYLVIAPVVRVVSYVAFPGQRDDIWHMFHTRADSLLIGCLLALLPVSHPAVWARVVAVVTRRWVVPTALTALLVSSAAEFALGGLWLFPVGYTVDGVAAAVLVLAVLQGARGAGWLAWRPLTRVGIISFSLYLWQQVFLVDVPGQRPLLGHPGDWRWAVAGAAAAVLVATASQVLVERPFLALKARTDPTPPVAAAMAVGDPAEDQKTRR